MANESLNLALQHLERLKAEIRIYLNSVEDRIAELESDQVVKKSSIEELSNILQKALDNNAGIEIEVPSGNGQITHDDVGIKFIQTKIREVLSDFQSCDTTAQTANQLSDLYSSFRARMMSILNTLDLAIVGLRTPPTEENKLAQQKTNPVGQSSVSRAALGSSAIIRSQELERQRIAREIHDGPAQAIANVVLRMDILTKVFEKDPKRVPEELARMKNIAQGALDEIRGFIFDLRPMTLQDLGLVATIKRIVSSLKDLSSMDVRFVTEGEERPLGPLVTLAVFRITQEAINNLRKYAKCSIVWIQLKYLEDKVVLIVEDDGVGFDIEEVAQSQKKFTSFGLLGMHERAHDINAELDIIASPGEGTKVVLVVPTKNNPALETTMDERR